MVESRKVLILTAFLVCTAAVHATVIIQDDFESYANTAALNAVWPKGTGTDADSFLVAGFNGPTVPGNQAVEITTAAARRDYSFTPTLLNAGEYLLWAFDFEDRVGSSTTGRQYGQLLSNSAQSGGALNELIAVGQYNTVTKPGQVYSSSKYQARVAFAPGQGWFNLNTDRSVGWHRFEVRIYQSGTVDFYVDGQPDTLGLPHVGAWWYQARIGSGLSSTAAARYDNYLLQVLPEPGAALLLGLGSLLWRRRRI